MPDFKQKHKQVSGFQGSKPHCFNSTGDPCSASFVPSVATCWWCPSAQHCIWESSPIHLMLTVLPFLWMRTGLQWAYSEQWADGRRALSFTAVRQGVLFSSSRGSGTFLPISQSAGIKLWALRSHCLFPLHLMKALQHSLAQKFPCTPYGSVMGEVPHALQGRKRHCQKAKGESLGDVRTLHVLLLPHMHTHAHNTNALHIQTGQKKVKKGGMTIYSHRPGQSQSYRVTLPWVRREFSFY